MTKKLNKQNYLSIYSCMLEIRRFEERAAQLYGMGHIGGFLPFIYRTRSSSCWNSNDNR